MSTLHAAPLSLNPTNLAGHLSFETPPARFDPLRATAEELRRYGIPHRPDPKRSPKASQLWQRAMKRLKKLIVPELAVRRGVVHGNRAVIQNSQSNSWSGLICQSQAPYIEVFATWIVPSVTVPPGGADGYHSSFWIGLNDAQSLLQTGTEQDANLSTGIFGGLSSSYYAWFEWFPGPSVQISNFPVSPGDAMVAHVEALDDGSGSGLVALLNMSTGIGTSIVVPIPTVDFNGNPINPAVSAVPSAEADWILERPSFVNGGNLIPSALSDFGFAVMASGGAVFAVNNQGKSTSQVLTVGDNDGGTILNMISNDGVTVLSVASEEPELVFQFTGGPTT